MNRYELFKNLLFNNPPFRVLENETNILDHNENINSVIGLISTKINDKNKVKKKRNIIILLGNWGSGKTIICNEFQKHKDYKSKYNFYYRSFFSIHNLNEAYLFLCHHLIKILVFLLILSVIIIYFLKFMLCIDFFKFCCPINTNYGLILSGITLFLSYIFVTNKFKITYLLCMLFHIHEKPDVYILDDLDRSSLKEEDRWALLANLWEDKTHYIVPLGYDNYETRVKYYELANKIEAEVIFIVNNWKINEKILTQYISDMPFEKEGETVKIKKLPFKEPGMIPEKWTIKFHNFLHTLKVQDNQGQSAHEFDYKTPQYIL